MNYHFDFIDNMFDQINTSIDIKVLDLDDLMSKLEIEQQQEQRYVSNRPRNN